MSLVPDEPMPTPAKRSHAASALRFWIVTHFEPIPTETEARPMRAGLLARRLVDLGHEVVWWTPDFDHYHKRHRTGGDACIRVAAGFEVRLLKSLGYRSHVGPRRLLHHELLAARWRRAVGGRPPPDLVFAGWPTPEFASSAVSFACRNRIASVVDVRDLWPDLWLDRMPSPIRPLGRIALGRYDRMANRAMAGADAILGVTDDYVDWGVRHAGRPRRPDDRAFAFRYRAPEPSAAELARAEASLADMGFARDERLTLVFAGAFGRTYGLEIALEAGRILDREAPDLVRIALLGSGDRWEAIARAARSIRSVTVLPRVGVAELSAAYRRADLGLAPYLDIDNYRRNLPNKIDEYLSAGLPIVAGVGGAIGRLIDEHGVGVRYGADDPASLARTAMELARDPERRSTLRARVERHRSSVLVSDEISGLAEHLEHLARKRIDGASATRGERRSVSRPPTG